MNAKEFLAQKGVHNLDTKKRYNEVIAWMEEYAALSQLPVIGSSIPNPPEFPLNRVLRDGVGHFCTNCGSTVSKDGFLGLFGEMLCHNEKCPNSKSKKNYR